MSGYFGRVGDCKHVIKSLQEEECGWQSNNLKPRCSDNEDYGWEEQGDLAEAGGDG